MIEELSYYFLRNSSKVQKVNFARIFEEFRQATLQFVTADEMRTDLHCI